HQGDQVGECLQTEVLVFRLLGISGKAMLLWKITLMLLGSIIAGVLMLVVSACARLGCRGDG
ncbi:MAG: hypothetical protein P1U90_09040, partial [Akkermansiaceae bacterium]|nr:hypothetical protein [Akkermansiaceae bacterium]